MKSQDLVYGKELSFENNQDIVYLAKFCKDIYGEEHLDNLIYKLYRYGDNKNEDYKYHIILVKDAQYNVVACGIYSYYTSYKTGVIELLTINDEYKNQDIDKQLYESIIKLLVVESKHNLHAVLLNNELRETNKEFWNTNGFKKINNFISMGTNGTKVDANLIKSMLYDYFKYSMDIKEPNKDKDYRTLRNRIKTRKSFKTKD